MSKKQNVDVAIVGAGTAGLSAYREARKYTDRIVLIEGGNGGTTCAQEGCMPSKLLIAAAEAARQIKRAPAFGLKIAGAEVSGAAVLSRVRRERDRFVRLVKEGTANISNDRQIKGYATFVSPQCLQVGDLQIEARSIVLATGSATFIPDMFKPLSKRLVTSADVFEWQDLPQSVAVFGAGIVGLELGVALHHLGVRVAIFGKNNNLAGISDPEVHKVAEDILSQELPIDLDANVQSLTETDRGVDIQWQRAGQKYSETFEYVLVSAGRTPNLAGLKLERLGVQQNPQGLPHWDPDTLQIKGHPIFLAGDNNNEKPLLHEAGDEGRLAGYNAAHYPEVKNLKRRSSLAVVFSHPQIMQVGTAYQDLALDCTAIGAADFSDQGRSRVILENQGLLRVYAAHENQRFLGAEMVGPAAEHLAHLLAWAHQQKMRIPDMLKMPFYHPTIEEGLKTALKATRRALKEGPAPGSPCGGEYVIAEPGDFTA